MGLGMVLIAIILAAVQKFGALKSLIWGICRAVAQLIGVGFILTAVFDIQHPALLVFVLSVMMAVAAWTASKRVGNAMPNMLWVSVISICTGSSIVLIYALTLTLNVEPWFSPRYLIPLAGIVIAFCMNAVALAGDRLLGELSNRRLEIESLLSLGADPRRAAASSTKAALHAAWTPLLNHLMVVGIVQLPGMMTGQIIAGASPLDAVRYQILIAFMLAAGVAISTALTVELGFRQAFNKREQLVLMESQ
jgi:putative ABC transport system permease protein